MKVPRTLSRRSFMRKSLAAGALAPMIVSSRVFGANDRIALAGIGMGSQGRGDLRGLMGFDEIQAVAVCDVVGRHAQEAKRHVDERYNNSDCKIYTDYREVLARSDIDAVLIGTPDHWHAVMSIEAMASGKDVYCEKPETLTVREGRAMAEAERRYGAVFCGGSQRVWGDYNWYHKMVQGGAIGEVKEAWVDVGGPSGPCYLPPMPTPDDVNWDLWLGPAPWRPFHESLIKGDFRPYRDYSGGGMTDWGCHAFGGSLFALGLHETGPVEIIPPDGKDVKQLTYVFANGVRIYHGGGWGWGDGGQLSFRGTEGEIPSRDQRSRQAPPNIHIPNYKGNGGIFGDFVHCIKTRERPFRSIERAHRTATVAHLGNIVNWLNRPIRWDPEKEEIVGDAEASRLLDRTKREPWSLS
jgi:predicted dehydrogenase